MSANIYRLDTDIEGKEFVQPMVSDSHALFQLLNGRVLSHEWKPFELNVISVGDDGEKLSSETDNFYLAAHVFVFNRTTIDVLREMLTDCGELLTVKCKKRNVKLYNCTTMLDAVDESSSDIVRFRDGRVLHLRHLVLDDARCSSHDIFRLSIDPLGGVYVSEAFRERVESAKLRGFLFHNIETRTIPK